jgi:hypothetical protein
MKKEILGKYILQTATPEYAKQEAKLQKIVFPTLSEEELMTEAHYKRHIEIFPQGQMIVLDGDRVIAATTLMQNYHKDIILFWRFRIIYGLERTTQMRNGCMDLMFQFILIIKEKELEEQFIMRGKN